jgi:hypothetical protein
MQNAAKAAIAICVACGGGFAALGEERAPNLEAITAIIARQAAASRPLFSRDLSLNAGPGYAANQTAPAPALSGGDNNSVPSANLSTTGQTLAPVLQSAPPAHLPNTGLVPTTQD